MKKTWVAVVERMNIRDNTVSEHVFQVFHVVHVDSRAGICGRTAIAGIEAPREIAQSKGRVKQFSKKRRASGQTPPMTEKGNERRFDK